MTAGCCTCMAAAAGTPSTCGFESAGPRPVTAAPQLLISADMALNCRVARYKHGQLVTSKRALALDYLKSYFCIDLLSGGWCSRRGSPAALSRVGRLVKGWLPAWIPHAVANECHAACLPARPPMWLTRRAALPPAARPGLARTQRVQHGGRVAGSLEPPGCAQLGRVRHLQPL